MEIEDLIIEILNRKDIEYRRVGSHPRTFLLRTNKLYNSTILQLLGAGVTTIFSVISSHNESPEFIIEY